MLTLVRSLMADSEHFFLVQLGGEESGLVHIYTTCAETAQTHRSPPHYVPEGFASVPYRIPFRNYSASSVHLEFRILACGRRSRRACVRRPGRLIGREATSLPVLRKSVFVFTDLSKPIYKPRDDVRFRVLALYPAHLHPERFGFRESAVEGLRLDSVRLESPRGVLMALWRNVSWMRALRGFTYSLPQDPQFGRWSVVARSGQVVDRQPFSVRRFVLPRFTMSVHPPAFLRADSANVSFRVCAQHGNGLPIKAQVFATLCLRPQSEHGRELCLNASARLDGSNVCVRFVEDTEPFKLRDCDLRMGHYLTALAATVEEDGTKVALNRSALGGELTFYPFRIVVDSPDFFKPGLPYYGRARTLSPDNSTVPGARLLVRFEATKRSDAFEEVFTADGDGVVRFQIPALFDDARSVNLQFQWADFQRDAGCEALRRPETFFVLRRLYSRTGTFIQAVPLSREQAEAPCKTGYLSLRLQSSVPLHDKTISVVGTARGILMSGQTFGPRRKQLCRDTDDSALGHYQCVGEKDGVTQIKCLTGWRGRNCLTPICSHGCERGVCRSRDLCVCQRHWTGVACHRCRRSTRCVHGVCRRGGDCVCQPDWTGYNCDRRRTFASSAASRPLTDTVVEVKRPDLSEERPVIDLTLFERDIELRISPQLSPVSRLAVWFLLHSPSEGREFVTTSVTLDALAACMHRDVPTAFSFDRAEVRPGELVTARIRTTGAQPHCALSLTDVTLDQFQAGPGLSEDLESTLRGLGELLTAGEPSAATKRRRCEKPASKTMHQDPRPPDSSEEFRASGLLVLSSVSVVTAPCPPPRYQVPGSFNDYFGTGGRLQVARQRKPGGAKDAKARPATEAPRGRGDVGKKASGQEGEARTAALRQKMRQVLRKFFPESWRFELLSSPAPNLTLWAPDSITTWQSRLYCVSSRGLGVSPPARLVVFQPFFLQISLPYSLVRGESVRIPVQVFSYVRRCAQVDVRLANTLLTVSGQSSYSACLCNFNQITVHFAVASRTLGWMPLEVRATLKDSPRCAGVMSVSSSAPKPKKAEPMEDAVQRRILVEPEGVPEVVSDGDLFCVRNSSQEGVVRVAVPNGVALVSGSERAYLSWSANVVTASLKRLDRLISLPYGCGEQNMMGMVPSIYVADYLSASDNGSRVERPEKTMEKAKRFMTVGYQRQLSYRHNDGSFSAFGRFDNRGSTWLTAFVVKSFAAASRHIDIDLKVVHAALTFLRGKTRSDGCFREDGRVLTPGLKGGMTEEKDEVSITAYVLAALLETKAVLHPNSTLHRDIDLGVRKALACLRRFTPASLTSLSTYTVALRSYALTRAPALAAEPQRGSLLAELRRRGRKTRSGHYWAADGVGERDEGRDGARDWIRFTAEDVETTGYALLSEMASRAVGGLQQTVRWLVSQRSDRGGWFSTQDTIAALQALTAFSRMTQASESADMILSLSRADEQGIVQEFKIDPASRLVNTKVRVPVPTALKVKVTGSGCVAIQQHVLFNVGRVGREGSPFSISVTASQRPDQCSRAKLTACASYRGANASNMAIMRVGMASGWEVGADEFLVLRSFMKEGGLRRAEVARDKALLLYFDRLTAARSCVRLTLTRRMEVHRLRPMLVQVYDYYRPDVVEETSVSVLSRKCLPRKRRVVGTACPRCVGAAWEETLCRNGSVWLAAVWGGPGRAWSFASRMNESGLFWSGALTFSQSCHCPPGRGGLLTRAGAFDVAETLSLDGSWTLLPFAKLLKAAERPEVKRCVDARPDLRFALVAGREMLKEATEAEKERGRSTMTLERPEKACPVCARHVGPAVDAQLREAAANGSLVAYLVAEQPEGKQWVVRRLLGAAKRKPVTSIAACRDLSCSYERLPDGSRLFLVVTRDRRKMDAPTLRPDGDFLIGAPRKVLRLAFARVESGGRCARCLAEANRSWLDSARLSYLLLRGEAVLLAVDASRRTTAGEVWTFRDPAGRLVANRCVRAGPRCPGLRCGVAGTRRLAVLVLLPKPEFEETLWRGSCLTLDGRFLVGEFPRS